MGLLVAVVGMQQSGSTLLFNLARYICEEMKISFFSCWYNHKFNRKVLEMYKVVIVKTHGRDQWLANNADVLLIPVRDVRDASISYCTRTRKKWQVAEHLKNMIVNINFFEAWNTPQRGVDNKKKGHHFVYEHYMAHREEWIAKVAHWMKVAQPLKKPQIMNIISKTEVLLKSPKKGSLMTRAHNTSGGKMQKYMDFFSLEDHRKILRNPKVRNFLVKFNLFYRL